MRQSIPTTNQAVRTIFHLSPSVSVAAVICAQQRGLSLGEWLDRIVVDACAAPGPADERAGTLTDDMTVELFAHVSSYSPGLLTGRWRLLFDRIVLDDSLWDYPTATVEDLEDGMDNTATINVVRLRRQWPQLLAAAFGL